MDYVVEVFGVDLHGLGHWRQRIFACAASSNVSKAFRRNSIWLATRRAISGMAMEKSLYFNCRIDSIRGSRQKLLKRLIECRLLASEVSVYSLRSACMGSTWLARSAGRHMAKRETTSRMSAEMLYTEGSKVSIRIHESFVRRIQAHAAGMAIASPRRRPRPIWRRPLSSLRGRRLAGRSQRHLNAEFAHALTDCEGDDSIDAGDGEDYGDTGHKENDFGQRPHVCGPL